MSTHKHIDKICVAVTVVTLLLAVLFMNGKTVDISAAAGEYTSSMFTVNDLNGDWDTSGASKIVLSDEGTTVKGNGAYVYDGDIYIVYAGKYMLSGSISNGSIIVNADRDDEIWLMLDGVSVHSDDDAAIRIEQADHVFLTLADGTENTVSSGSKYSTDAVSAGVDGTVYSRDDLTINGNGTLNVTAEYQHGIVCNDDLVITGGSIAVEAVQDGFHANDSVRIKDAEISIFAGDDGITASNDDETAYLYIESGEVSIPSCYEGLEAIDILIAGGTIDITPTDDGINANGNGGNSVIRITGGDITVTNEAGRDADGLDSNKDIYISGGNLFISVSDNGGNSAIDYGTENGGVCEISGGTVLACGSSGMAEGFDSASTQGFIMYNTSAAAGTAVTLKDADGSELISREIPCSFSSVVVSTPEMNVGDTCIIAVGDNQEEVTIDNTEGSFGFGQGQMPGQAMQGGRGEGGRGQGGMFGIGENERDVPAFSDGENFGREQPGTPPDLPQGNEEFGGEQPGTPPELPQGNEEFGGEQPDTLPEPSRGDGDFDGRFNRGDMQNMEINDAIPTENIVLLGISAGVLILGCVIAFFFKCRK